MPLVSQFHKTLSVFLLSVNLINFPRQTTAPSINPITWATTDQVHAGENTCVSSNGTTAYTCSFNTNKSLTKYTLNMQIPFQPDVDCISPTNCTLNIDKNGILSIKNADGTVPTLLHAHMYWLFYTGANWQPMG